MLASLEVEEVRLPAALVHEELGELEIVFPLCDPRQLDERQLDLLVPVIAVHLSLAGAEHGGDVIDIAAHDVEQLPLAGGLEVGHRPFDQMSGRVEFVRIAQVGPAQARLDPLEPAVEVAVGLLQLAVEFDDRIDLGLELRIGPPVEAIGCRLDDLAEVRIPEHLRSHQPAVIRNDLTGRRPVDIDLVEHAGGNAPIVEDVDGSVGDHVGALAPEPAHFDLRDRGRPEPARHRRRGNMFGHGKTYFTAPAVRPRT